jgi:hypothetical protein
MTPIRVRTIIPITDISSRRLGLLVTSFLAFFARFYYQRTAHLLNDDTGFVFLAVTAFLILSQLEFMDVRPVETYIPTKVFQNINMALMPNSTPSELLSVARANVQSANPAVSSAFSENIVKIKSYLELN